jgi:hypothetical protein
MQSHADLQSAHIFICNTQKGNLHNLQALSQGGQLDGNTIVEYFACIAMSSFVLQKISFSHTYWDAIGHLNTKLTKHKLSIFIISHLESKQQTAQVSK